ncbi:hypothetical protein SESBI_22751 [Sesbania bispinosa]|nr:hypothetical protein SESBI_22751 [Sesbania bispinosa]
MQLFLEFSTHAIEGSQRCYDSTASASNYISCRAKQGIEDEEKATLRVELEALDKGPVPPSGPSGCTYIPGSGGTGTGTHCPVNQMNVAGSTQHHRARAAYPRLVVPFGVATNQH